MLVFDTAIKIHIADRRGRDARRRWAGIFARLFGCFNASRIIGGWQGPRITETEDVSVIVKWGISKAEVYRIAKYLQWYQAEAEQEAVSIELCIGGLWSAQVVFSNEWAAFLGRVEYLYSRAAENEQMEEERWQEVLDFFSHKS
jgi:hypothetical protein